MSRAFILEQIRNSLSPDKARSTRQAVVSARIGEHQRAFFVPQGE